MSIPSHIFHAYDIRGLWETELSSEFAYRLGRAFVRLLRSEEDDLSGKRIVVGRDMRPSSGEFYRELTRGVCDEGVDVLNIGLASTPLFNFACTNDPNIAGGVMVTASHNTAEYNGFKMTRGNGLPVGQGSGMEEIRDMVIGEEFRIQNSEFRIGDVVKREMVTEYVKKLFSLISRKEIRPMKIVIDFGNGMGGVTIPAVLKELPVDAMFLYETPDGTFPNHEANPLKKETLRNLQKMVVDQGADFGFALDGDADRIGVVDETGEVVDASAAGALIGAEALRDYPESAMLYDLRSSRSVKEYWEARGAKTQMTRVGHAYIKKMMKETGAVFASELSLHLYYRDLGGMESSDLSLLYLLRLLSREHEPLSELVAPLLTYVHSGEINFSVADKDSVLRSIEAAYAGSAAEVSHLDGLWMSFPWGWFNVRKSNTEPLLRLNLEADTKEGMEEKVEEIQRLIV